MNIHNWRDKKKKKCPFESTNAVAIKFISKVFKYFAKTVKKILFSFLCLFFFLQYFTSCQSEIVNFWWNVRRKWFPFFYAWNSTKDNFNISLSLYLLFATWWLFYGLNMHNSFMKWKRKTECNFAFILCIARFIDASEKCFVLIRLNEFCYDCDASCAYIVDVKWVNVCLSVLYREK